MSDDIRHLLDEWPYQDNDELMVRRVHGPNGELRLQVRLELGLLELHVTGRPDGQRPYGHATLLDYYRGRVRDEQRAESDEPFTIVHDDCLELQRESMQFYHRRLSFLKIGEFAAAAADAEHNLAIMDLLRDRADDRADWLASEQFRPFVLSHWTRARMLEALSQGDSGGAIQAVEDGIATIEKLYRDEYQRPDQVEHSEELVELRRIRQALLTQDLPALQRTEDEEERLERELREAIAAEDFERAARLRDALRARRQP